MKMDSNYIMIGNELHQPTHTSFVHSNVALCACVRLQSYDFAFTGPVFSLHLSFSFYEWQSVSTSPTWHCTRYVSQSLTANQFMHNSLSYVNTERERERPHDRLFCRTPETQRIILSHSSQFQSNSCRFIGTHHAKRSETKPNLNPIHACFKYYEYRIHYPPPLAHTHTAHRHNRMERSLFSVCLSSFDVLNAIRSSSKIEVI